MTAWRAYDLCFAYEIAIILEHGLEAMLERQDDVFYYLTLMNENYVHASMPEGAEEGVVRGMYLARASTLAEPLPAGGDRPPYRSPSGASKSHVTAADGL
jgi:pyruvate dehydrogenase complex dehydrogenase (E1) component